MYLAAIHETRNIMQKPEQEQRQRADILTIHSGNMGDVQKRLNEENRTLSRH